MLTQPAAPPHHCMQHTFHLNLQRATITTTTSDYKASTSGEFPNPHHHFINTHQTNKHIDICSIIKSNIKPIHYQIVKSSNLLHKARLHAQKGGEAESNKLTSQKTCNHQMANRGKAVHDAIMRSPTDTTMEDMEDTMVIENIQTKRTQETKKGGSSSKRKKNAELIT